MSSDNATIELDFTFTCVTTETVITFDRDSTTVCTITGSNTDGTCVLGGDYITDYTYTCSPTTNTYTITIPGSYLTNSYMEQNGNVKVHSEKDDQVLRYCMLMVSYFFYFFLFL